MTPEMAKGATASSAAVDIVVVVPTFRRPAMLENTLRSLEAQIGAPPFAVVVVENDAAGQAGLAVAQAAFDAGRLNGIAVLEPQQGNVHAINCGFATALSRFPSADFFLMIDDDELASPHWLAELVAVAKAGDADIAGGPVKPKFAAPTPLSGHPVFWPIDARTGPIPMIYGSGNCLIRRRAFDRLGAPAFDVQFNYLGGGDIDFFTRAKAAGLKFYWAEEALIAEAVEPNRVSRQWIIRRGLRIGSINRRLDLKRYSPAKVWLKDLAILALSPFRVFRDLLRTRNGLTSLHPLVIALGRLGSAFGWQVEQYRSKQ